MAETRVYLVIDGGGLRTPTQWQILITGLKAKPMSAAIIAEARSSPHNTVEINRFSLPNLDGNSQYMLGDFEMSNDSREGLLITLEGEVQRHGIDDQLGTKEQFRQVMLAEIREVATDAGFGALAPLLDFTIIGFGGRNEAIVAGHVWIEDHRVDWIE